MPVMTLIGSVASAHRCPVKSMQGETLHSVTVSDNGIDGADVASGRVGDGVLEPGRESGAGRDLDGVLGERTSRTQPLGAGPPLLDPHHLDGPRRTERPPTADGSADAPGRRAPHFASFDFRK